MSRRAGSGRSVVIDYGNGVRKTFSLRNVRRLRKYKGLPFMTRRMLKEITREWAESCPELSKELSFAR